MNTRTIFFAIAIFFCAFANTQAQNTIIYVRPNANGDGKSWTNAMGNLQLALLKAKRGMQVWVAQGTYLPTTSNDRTASFVISDGVQLYGGFAGTETTLAQRSFMKNPTILSGNIGNEDADDNVYNVIYTKNVNSSTVLDGFTVTGGYANGSGLTSNRLRSGGAWYNDGSDKGQSNPTITNCTFVNNFAKDGGAIYNNGKGGEASPTIKDCVFSENSCDLDGGALYNDGRANGNSNAVITGCTFDTNKGNYGGAVFNYGMNGNAEPTFSDCVFSTNRAYVKGGAVFHLTEKELLASDMFGNSVFNNNVALDHGSDEVHQYLIGTRQMASN